VGEVGEGLAGDVDGVSVFGVRRGGGRGRGGDVRCEELVFEPALVEDVAFAFLDDEEDLRPGGR